jgi:serine/threonine-protein kinase RsbW
MRLSPSPIELTMPGDSRFLRLARLFASGVAMGCGLPLEEIEDYRIVIDEIGAALIETGRGAPVHLLFLVAADRLIVEGTTQAAHALDHERVALSDQILDVLTDDHHRVQDDGHMRVVATTCLRAAGVG